MAGDIISCKQFASYLITQEPVYDKTILQDIRPSYPGLIGYYETSPWDAYSGTTHTYDRVNSVFPDVTVPWNNMDGASCSGTPCDPSENKIGMGSTRKTVSLEEQSWGSQLFCFDQIMTKTKAKESLRYWVDSVLRPATQWIMGDLLQRKAFELAGKRIAVTTGLPELNFTWDAGGYKYLNITNAATGAAVSPTGLLTAPVLQTYVHDLYAVGATVAGKDGYDHLELHTDKDTFQYLSKRDPNLQDAWRIATFNNAAKELYQYGFNGMVGDYMVKVLQFPPRFNKVANGRFQRVLPYKNVAGTQGIKSIPNPDYQNAQYQISLINNKRALRVQPFNPEAVSKDMPFKIRDYGGKWQFVQNNLGGDCDGRPIDNSRMNKGKFIADFRLAVKPEHEEFLIAVFHMVDKPCVTIIAPCNSDPGYPAQTYDSANEPCPTEIEFTAVKNGAGNYVLTATGATCDGNVIPLGTTTTNADLGDFVDALQTKWDAAGQDGTWTVEDETAGTILLTGTTCASVELSFSL